METAAWEIATTRQVIAKRRIPFSIVMGQTISHALPQDQFPDRMKTGLGELEGTLSV